MILTAGTLERKKVPLILENPHIRGQLIAESSRAHFYHQTSVDTTFLVLKLEVCSFRKRDNWCHAG